MTLELHVAPSSELVRWILQFGAEVEVDAPTSLRTQVAAHLRKATGLYDAEEGLPAHRRDRAKMKGPRPTLPRSTLHPKGDVS